MISALSLKQEGPFDFSSEKYKFKIKYKYITSDEKKDRINPCIPYNIGFELCKGDIIIIQNAECFHVGNILQYLIDNLNENDYITFSCFSTN